MFPNPQDAFPLPPHPDIEQHRKLAKELVKACKRDQREALHQWAQRWLAVLMKSGDGASVSTAQAERRIEQVSDFAVRKLANGRAGPCRLANAQLVIARCYGFPSWAALTRHTRALANEDSETAQFEAAAEAVVSGDVTAL